MIPDIEYTPAKFTALKTPEKNLGRQEPDACPPGSPPGSLCGAHDSNDVAGEMGAGRAAALPRSDEPALRWGDRDSPRGGRRPPGGLLLQLPAGPAVSQSPRVWMSNPPNCNACNCSSTSTSPEDACMHTVLCAHGGLRAVQNRAHVRYARAAGARGLGALCSRRGRGGILPGSHRPWSSLSRRAERAFVPARVVLWPGLPRTQGGERQSAVASPAFRATAAVAAASRRRSGNSSCQKVEPKSRSCRSASASASRQGAN